MKQNMKSYLLSVIIFLICFLQREAAAAGSLFPEERVAEKSKGLPTLSCDSLDLFLLIGQSNMAGRGEILVPDSLSGVYSLDKENNWVTAKDPLHFDKKYAGVGPGLMFAKEIRKVFPDYRIGLIPCAVGGTSISKWMPGACDEATGKYPYDDMIARLKTALKQGRLRGILWHQGEGDYAGGNYKRYETRFDSLLYNISKDTGIDLNNIPIIIGELGYFLENKHNGNEGGKINEVLHRIAYTYSNIYCVSSKGLTDKGDKLHFDTPSANELGRRYAEAYLLLNTRLAAKTAGISLVPTELTCEYLKNPLGLDVKAPRLSWKLESLNKMARGQKQTAYRVLVSSSKELLQEDKGDLWDSGEVSSDNSVLLIYKGKELISNQTCYWKVRIADESGQWSDWSPTAYWTVGLFSGDWEARWIAVKDASERSLGGKPVDNSMPDPWFRKTFDLEDFPQSAFIYVASVGYHELYINGERMGENVLAPSVTNHRKRARYVTYDITRYLKKGRNVIALWLGTSWSIFPAYQTEDKPAAPMVTAQAEVLFSDNRRQTVITDETWKTRPSPNMLIGYWDAHHFGGEKYDARLEIPGWNAVDFDDSSWEKAVVFTPDLIISSDKTEPNKLQREITPVSVSEPTPGTYRIDMGTNYAGWFEMELKGEPGDEIKLEFSEREKDTSSYGLHSIYIIGKEGKGTFRNRFNYMSGRWITVTGLRNKPDENAIRGWMIRPEYERTGYFECNIPLLNDIYNASLRTFENLSLGNYVVDCPHRERRGYGGDALATTRPALGNYALGAFYSKWGEDWRDVQEPDGSIPHTAPTYLGGGGPSWSGFCIELPWEVYRQYGDKQLLEENFSTMEGWLAYLETQSENDMLVRWGGKWSFLGDWLWPNAWDERSFMEKQGKALGDTRETLFFNNCNWIYTLDLTARIADILENGKTTGYRERADKVRKAVHKTFFNPEDNSYVNGYPGYLGIALAAGVPPIDLRSKVWERLEREISVHRNGHVWAGITAGSYLMNTLIDHNRNELIYTMATKEDFPGWGHMLKTGNTCFFEDWHCRGSGLHSSYLYIGSWFLESLGGIRRPEAGFKHFLIEPWIDKTKGIDEVYASYNSLYGLIDTKRVVKNGKLQLEITVPPNTEAVLRLKEIDPHTMTEGDKPLKSAEGVELKSLDRDSVEIGLQSGRYIFQIRN